MDASTPPPGFYFLVAVFWLVVAGTILMVLLKLAAWWSRRYPMSSAVAWEAPKKAAVPPAVATFTAAEQPIVTPNNEYSGGLSNNERLAFDTTAKSIAAMYQKGVITNVSKAICAAYGCTVQSAAKTDSTYQMALKAVNKHLPKKDAPQFRMTPEMEDAREALGLNKAH